MYEERDAYNSYMVSSNPVIRIYIYICNYVNTLLNILAYLNTTAFLFQRNHPEDSWTTGRNMSVNIL